MRNKKKIVVYPCYFDVRRSRRMGRRVPRSIAVQKPQLDELRVIADHLKLDYELDPEARHPAVWYEENVGRLLIKKSDLEGQPVLKAKLVKKMAKYLQQVKKKKKEKREQKEKQGRYKQGQRRKDRRR
ncbi:MAG: signal recognition particle subunit SRP19/SEC65 family protein [Candidatus Hodarchaeota archaeon]